MKRFLYVFPVLFLFFASNFSQWEVISIVKAVPDIYQGNLILQGDNVTLIEGRFDINGSITVEENATLRLEDAYLNFTQVESLKHNLTLRNPQDGNPRLQVYNSTITSKDSATIWLWDNNTVIIHNSTINTLIYARNNTEVTVSSSPKVQSLNVYDFSIIKVHNSSISVIKNFGSHEVLTWNSEINGLYFSLKSVGCTISNLSPALVDYWSFVTNCSVSVFPGGSAPNVTLTNTYVDKWHFGFIGNSNASIADSHVFSVVVSDEAILSLKSTTSWYGSSLGDGVLWINDSTVDDLFVVQSSSTWVINSTVDMLAVIDTAQSYFGWYLDISVVDSLNNAVPSANATAAYTNTTIAEQQLTDSNGEARLMLIEKLMNASGEYPIGNYTMEATYGLHSASTSLNMTENKQITLKLEGFVIPEFPSLILLPLIMLCTLIATVFYRRKNKARPLGSAG